MPLNVYRSTDASAPTLAGTTGSLVTVLDACLVNGYTGKTAAGWTKPFSGTSKAIYLQGGSSNQRYFRVRDDGPNVTSTFREAQFYGCEGATGIDTTTALFPTVAQLSTGNVIRKSATADATARAWIIVADERTCYIFIQTGDTAGCYSGYVLGDIFSYVAADAFRQVCIGRFVENVATYVNTNDGFILNGVGALTSAQGGNFICRPYTGSGGSATVSKLADATVSSQSTWSNQTAAGCLQYPNGSDTAVYVSPMFIHDAATACRRGELRGLYMPCHAAANFADGDILPGGGSMAGRSLLLIKGFGGATTNPPVAIDITGPWPTSA